MSRIYFHSPSENDVEVRGAERAHLGQIISNVFVAAMQPFGDWLGRPSWLRAFLPSECYVLKEPVVGGQHDRFERSADTYLRVGDHIVYDGQKRPIFDLKLNTALVIGSDHLRLAARIHGQCEIHAWVKGESRSWLAGMITHAVKAKVFRAGMGWDAAIALLEKRADEPVVLSYSVCKEFPNADVLPDDHPAAHDVDDNRDGWHALPDDEKWRLGIAWLPENAPELSPDTWGDYHFTDGVTAFDLKAAAERTTQWVSA